jgi:hypothetical protein
MVAGWSPDFSNHVLLKMILWNEIKKGIRGLSMGYSKRLFFPLYRVLFSPKTNDIFQTGKFFGLPFFNERVYAECAIALTQR